MNLAKSLGLKFQLEAIDYTSPRFMNSDLCVHEVRDLLAEQEGAAKGFEGLLDAMQGDSLLSGVMKLGLQLLGTSPKLQALGKLALIETLAAIQGDPSQIPGLDRDTRKLLEVLIENRNQRVVDDLVPEMKRLRRSDSVSIFYGTGHMPDLEKRVRDQLGYRPAGELWLTAFSVNLATAGVSPAEREFIHNVVQKQLAELRDAQPNRPNKESPAPEPR
jgi:hypothetical protein